MMLPETLSLVVSAVRAEALDVLSIELRDPRGGRLPPFSPGAHLEIELPGAGEDGATLLRHYSLCNAYSETDRYQVAVGLAPNGRGGSRHVHAHIRVGTTISARPPRNNFELCEEAQHYRFIAGGIGITPILSMLRWCETNGKSWSLLYCARSRIRTAFYEQLSALGSGVRFHFSDEADGGLADLEAELAMNEANEHVYCCGPQSLMQAVRSAGAHRPADSLHFEWFSSAQPDGVNASADAFEVLVRSRGLRLRVERNKSILETLEEHGISVPFSCREGLCRTCETPLCGGVADHRDFVLSEQEQHAQTSLMVCVSRAKTPLLELDI